MNATGLDGVKRCPTCRLGPSMTVEDKVLGQPGQDIVLRCEMHGHVAQGDTLEEAVRHWNRYIDFTVRAAGGYYLEYGPGKLDETYCAVCGVYTRSKDFPDRIECDMPYCHAVKLWKDREVA